MYKLFFLLCLLACTHRGALPVKSTTFDNQTGQTVVFRCGRGCMQYLVKTDGVLYAPVELPATYQVDQATFRFSGALLPDSTVVNTFGPDDRLVPDFKVRNLKINKITAH